MKKESEGSRPPYGLVELVRRKNAIYILRQAGLSEDGLSLRKMLPRDWQLPLGCRDGPPTCIDLGPSYVTFDAAL
jgi:hypothetical protein